jgi:light-regulated signal transduction histidine kinase (bacteriophytochrome)
MNDSASRMRELIQALLMYSQLNKGTYHPAEVSLQQIATQATNDLELAITEKQATIHIEALPFIKGDANMLVQLFSNIIGNALKYAKANVPPHMQIDAQVVGHEHIIRFRDNGIGFSNEYATQIFNLFQRLHGKNEFNGTGIGLSVCKKIMELHNGRIWAEATNEQGATFYAAFPI